MQSTNCISNAFYFVVRKKSTNISNLYDLKNIIFDNKTQKDDYIYASLKERSLLDIYKTH